jgi:hypothetical protein
MGIEMSRTRIQLKKGDKLSEYLTFVKDGNTRNRRRRVWCRCECNNNIKEYYLEAIRRGNTKSCGCYRNKRTSESNSTHRLSLDPIYHVWKDMDQRGERCKDWASVKSFIEWGMKGWQKGFWLRRYDETQKFSPDNCYWEPKKFTEEYVHELIQKSHSRTIILLDPYKGVDYSHRFKCLECNHIWQTVLNNVINSSKSGCPQCNSLAYYSKVSIQWLLILAEKTCTDIQHAENGGEKILRGKSGKTYKVDGYDPKTRTIFEFHGDRWHGNLDMYKPYDKPNPFTNKSAKQLYTITKRKEMDLMNAGYKVIVVWEHDFRMNKLVSYILKH